MRVLLYGFGPYREFRDNITAKIIKSLPARNDLRKIIFPVSFQRGQFVGALRRHKPDVIVGLGQSSRKRIEGEVRAKNCRRSRPTSALRPIKVTAPKTLQTTLALKPGRSIGRSTDAGDYVCNYSMFILLEEIARKKLKLPFGFIHIPYDCDLLKARRVVERVLRQCQRRPR
ncbi:MAG: hypothetical protein EXR70_18715 [Deltaproteobacteria bacterium]|nr:hypothetical protein [Deltaproteobacteria bacterium]